ncbi:transcriptional regulator, MerR family, partial [Burkholderiales bacterium 1_1_47]
MDLKRSKTKLSCIFAQTVSSKNLLTIDELSQVSGLSKRTIRYYVNGGLLDRPSGETKNARYDASHLEQIRNIKALREKGYTLARIVELKRQTHQEVLNRREIGEPL